MPTSLDEAALIGATPGSLPNTRLPELTHNDRGPLATANRRACCCGPPAMANRQACWVCVLISPAPGNYPAENLYRREAARGLLSPRNQIALISHRVVSYVQIAPSSWRVRGARSRGGRKTADAVNSNRDRDSCCWCTTGVYNSRRGTPGFCWVHHSRHPRFTLVALY